MANAKLKTTFYSLLLVNSIVLCGCTKKNYLPSWMVGKWKTELNGISVVENWEQKNDHLSGLTIWDDHGLQSKEYLKLYFQESELVYEVIINKVKRKFVCNRMDNDTLIFVNNQNDFPRRIIYTKPIHKRMKVWIDNFQNDSHTLTFYFEKN